MSCTIAAFLFWERAKVPQPYHAVTEDHDRMFQALKSCDREWVAVFPPHIAGEGKEIDVACFKVCLFVHIFEVCLLFSAASVHMI